MNQYQAGKLTIYHFDFYRLQEAGIMREELEEALSNKGAAVVVEWADVVQDVLPGERLTIKITSVGEMERRLEFSYLERLNYLLPANT
jgi:tRNA threonylcarbamoyladenosine biosynthesis protein TsaE